MLQIPFLVLQLYPINILVLISCVYNQAKYSAHHSFHFGILSSVP
jgi:hypothetical protein